MGTRHLITVFDEQGDLKVAQYGQFDGYPSYTGVRALEWLGMVVRYDPWGKLRSPLADGLKRCRFGTDEEFETLYKQFPKMNYVGEEDEIRFRTLYPNLVRETGIDILGVVAYSVGEVLLSDQSDFAEDELMCEGIYSVNFQSGLFTSKFDGVMTTYPLSELPTAEQYLEDFANANQPKMVVGVQPPSFFAQKSWHE